MSGSFSDDVRLLLWVALTHVVTSYLVRLLLIVCTHQIVEMPIYTQTREGSDPHSVFPTSTCTWATHTHLQYLLHPDWWANVYRCHTAPFYDIRELLPESERASAPVPDVLGPRYWTAQASAPSQGFSHLTASQNLVSGTHSSLLNDWIELLVGHLSSKGA